MNEFITQLAILAPPLLLALTLHEVAHGYVAYRLGDPTARMLGRLTLNPLKHLDPIGTIAFFLIKFGWAKPVPVNPRYFRNPQRDMLWVALAGPITNLLLAIASAIVFKLLLAIAPMIPANGITKAILIPTIGMLQASVWINLVLCVFNFIPIPPLDGSKILMGVLPPKLAYEYQKVEKYGFIIILVLAFSGLLSKVIVPFVSSINHFFLS